MQVVGLDVASHIGFERAATAIIDALRSDLTAATIHARGSDAGERIDLRIADPDSPSLISYETGGEDPSAVLQDAIEYLAESGVTHAIVDTRVGFTGQTIAIGTDPTDRTLAVVAEADLDDREALDGVIKAIDAIEPYETLGSLVEQIQTHPDSPKAGALATFTGRVRADNLEEGRTTHLEYEKYEDVADEEMDAIRAELTARDGVYEVLMHHNTGVVPAEEDAVHVVVLAGHRKEAFRAVEDGIDLLKERVPIFKKEVTESGEYWAHDRP